MPLKNSSRDSSHAFGFKGPLPLFALFLGLHLFYRGAVLYLGWNLVSFANPPRQILTGLLLDLFVAALCTATSVLLLSLHRAAGTILTSLTAVALLFFLTANGVSLFYRGENIAPGDFSYLKEAVDMADSLFGVLRQNSLSAIALLLLAGALVALFRLVLHLARSMQIEAQWLRRLRPVALYALIALTARSGSLSSRMLQHSPIETHPLTYLHWRSVVDAAHRIARPTDGLRSLGEFQRQAGYRQTPSGVAGLSALRDFSVPNPHSVFTDESIRQLPPNTNVVIILAESLGRALPAANPGVSPRMMAQADKTIWLENHFTNSFRTCGAKFAALCSLDTPLGFFVQRDYPRVELQCLPQIFHKRGYSTKFVTGTAAEFDNKAEWMLHNGMESTYTAKDFPKGAERFSYGVHDVYLVERILQELDAPGEKPKFMVVVTASNHHPYVIPADFRAAHPEIAGFQPIEQATYYTDAMLGKLFDEASTRPWFQNTLFVVFGDHNPWGTSLGDPNTAQNLADIRLRYKTTAFLSHPLLKPNLIERDTSLLELGPTVLALLGFSNVESNLQYGTVFDPEFRGAIPAQENARGSAWVLFNRQQAAIRVGLSTECRTVSSTPAAGTTPCDTATRQATDAYRATFLDSVQWIIQRLATAGHGDVPKLVKSPPSRN
jgi:hypothetical protein